MFFLTLQSGVQKASSSEGNTRQDAIWFVDETYAMSCITDTNQLHIIMLRRGFNEAAKSW
jgi:hypothetical protein